MVNSSTNTDTMYKLNIDMVPLYMKSSKYTAFIDKSSDIQVQRFGCCSYYHKVTRYMIFTFLPLLTEDTHKKNKKQNSHLLLLTLRFDPLVFIVLQNCSSIIFLSYLVPYLGNM